jgi:hypothetical protein
MVRPPTNLLVFMEPTNVFKATRREITNGVFPVFRILDSAIANEASTHIPDRRARLLRRRSVGTRPAKRTGEASRLRSHPGVPNEAYSCLFRYSK